MSVEELKPSTFSTSPDESLDVVDVYDGGGIAGLNTDIPSGGSKSGGIAGLSPMQSVEARGIGTSGGAYTPAALKEAKGALPPKVNLKDVLTGKNKLSDVIVGARRVKDTLPARDFNAFTGDDLNFLINETSNMTKSVLAKDGLLTVADLKSANGADYAVLAAAGVFSIRKAMGKQDTSGLMGLIGKTKLPALFKESAMASILGIAAEYGLEKVVSSLFDIIGERLPKEKKKQTVQQLLRGFRFSNKPVVTQLSSGEKSLIASASDFFNVGKDTAKVFEAIIGREVNSVNYPTKEEQAVQLVNTLYKIDKNWNTTTRNGVTVHSLDNYRFASSDAIKALKMDERTVVGISIQAGHGVKPESWKAISKRNYRHLYV